MNGAAQARNVSGLYKLLRQDQAEHPMPEQQRKKILALLQAQIKQTGGSVP